VSRGDYCGASPSPVRQAPGERLPLVPGRPGETPGAARLEAVPCSAERPRAPRPRLTGRG
jgi:hypothetical protein